MNDPFSELAELENLARSEGLMMMAFAAQQQHLMPEGVELLGKAFVATWNSEMECEPFAPYVGYTLAWKTWVNGSEYGNWMVVESPWKWTAGEYTTLIELLAQNARQSIEKVRAGALV